MPHFSSLSKTVSSTLLNISLLTCAYVAVSAQQPGANQPPPAAPTQTLRLSVRRVVVDVTVTDANGKLYATASSTLLVMDR